MIGTWKWNVYIALLAMGITFIASLSSNEAITSFIRSLYGFAVVFVAVYAFRFILGTAGGLKRFEEDALIGGNLPSQNEEHTGKAVDLSTPADDGVLQDLLKQPQSGDSVDEGFAPLQPQKLVTKEKVDPELLAGALRQMSEE